MREINLLIKAADLSGSPSRLQNAFYILWENLTNAIIYFNKRAFFVDMAKFG